MARQVLPWVGAAIGFAAGGNWQLGFAIGSLIGNAVDPQTIRGPSIGEGQNNTASEGGYRPIVLGKGAVGVCMIHQGPTIKRTIRERQSKGGGPVTGQERIYRTMAFALGESAYPDTGVALLRLWIDNKLRYDVTPTSQISEESEAFAEEFTFYPGNDTQEPDPDLEAMPVEWGGGAGNVPAYRGGAPYIVLPEWDVTDSGGRAPMIKAELASDVRGQKVYALSPSQGRVYIDQTGVDWSGDYIEPMSIPNTIYAGGGAVTIAKTGECVVTFNDQDFAPVTGFTGSAPQSGLYSDYHEAWYATGGAGGGIWKSEDALTYAPLTLPVAAATNQGMARNNVLIFKGQSGNIFRSTDGNSFEYINLWLGVGDIKGMVATNEYFFIFRTDGSIWASASGGSGTWAEVEPAGTSVENTGGVAYDANRNIAVYCGNNGECLYNDGGTTWNVGTSHDLVTVSSGTNTRNCVFANGWFLVGSSGGATSGDIQAIRHPTDPAWTTVRDSSDPGTGGGEVTSLAVGYGSISSDRVTLASIYDFIHDRVDIPASKFDASTLTDPVEGVVFADGYTAADALRSGNAWYQVDAGEFDAGSGYKINYIKRGGAALATITESDIIDGPEDWEREDSYERPRVLHVAYPNPVADYGAPVIPIKRTSHDVLVVGERSVSIPFVTSDQDEVARRGDVAMTVIYTEIAGTVEVILPTSWLELAPTDCIGYSIRGRTRRLRMTNWRFQPDGTISTEWIADRQSAYTSNLTALPPVPSTPPPPSIVGPTISAVLDIPALVDSLDTLHLIVAASGQTPGWYGSFHQRQAPGDPDFVTALEFSAPTTIIGTLDDAVSDASEHFTDTTNVVRVTLYSDDELQTFTQQQFLSENGAFALSWEDSNGLHWEILQYRDAVKVDEQTWELTTLARGRLDTETAAHPSGSLFVLLDAGIRAIAMQSAWLDQDVTHRGVSKGQLPDQATPYTEEYTGESQREWPVANLFAELDGDTLEATWVPRHRFGTDDHPVRSVNWTGYRVTATDGANTLSADTTADSHSFDVTGWSTPITVSVSQLNRFTGEGPAVTEEVA